MKAIGIVFTLFFSLSLGAQPLLTKDDAKPVLGDLWDYSRVRITANSELFGGFSPEPIFGAVLPSLEPEDTVFADRQPVGTVHYVEWETTEPVAVSEIRVFATGDFYFGHQIREFERIVIRAQTETSTTYDKVLLDFRPTHPYTFFEPSTFYLTKASFPAVKATRFRAEFEQHESTFDFSTGPRLVELDAFGPLPKIVEQPSSLVVKKGDVANLQVSLETANASYQWFHNGDPVPDGTNNVLRLINANLEVSGEYYVVASLGGRTVKSDTVLVAIGDGDRDSIPGIVEQPKDIQATAGRSATFSVSASGANLSYQWLRNEAPILGATNASLLLRPVTAADAEAIFRVDVINGSLALRSFPVHLTVIDATPIDTSSSDLWDAAQGATILATSATISPAINMFGGNGPGAERNATIFADGRGAGTVHFVEWRTAKPAEISEIRVFAAGTNLPPDYARAFARMVIRAKSAGSSTYDRTLLEFVPELPYELLDPASGALVVTNLRPVIAQEFRAEFVESTNSVVGSLGPRVIEMDAFGRFAPETIADWTFEEGLIGNSATTALDASGNGHPLNSVGSRVPTFVLSDLESAANVSVEFLPGQSGIGPALLAADSTEFNLGSAFTIEVSVKPDTNNVGANRGIVVGQDSNSRWLAYALDYRSETETADFVIGNANGEVAFVSAVLPNDNGFHHLAGVYDNSLLKIYLDGLLVASTNSTITIGIDPFAAARLAVGANDIGGYPFSGVLERVRISGRALSPDQFFNDKATPGTTLKLLSALQNQTVPEGGSVTLEVQAQAPGPISYLWKLDGQIIPGANANVLTITNISPAQAGQYSVLVAQGGKVASASARITVIRPPVIVFQPVSKTVAISGSVSFSVRAESVVPVQYQWFFGDIPLAGQNRANFGITNVQVSDAGTYHVVVSNVAGSVSSVLVRLDLPPSDPEAPVVTITSPASGVVFDETITIEGTATDNKGIISLLLERNGIGLRSVPFTNGRFSITNVTLQGGTNSFRVIARDAVGNRANASVVLVLQPARLVQIPAVPPVQEGATVTFPLLLTTRSAEVGAATILLNYDAQYLENPRINWGAAVAGWSQVNTSEVGVVRFFFALPGVPLDAGEQLLANVSFRVRSVPKSLTTPLDLQLVGLYSETGDPFLNGNGVASGKLDIKQRRYIGDINANDRLDIGDASAIMRLVTSIDPVRSWDVPSNDLNKNNLLDAGDAIRVLRAAVNLDPQPGSNVVTSLATTQDSAETFALVADRTQLSPGTKLSCRIVLQGAQDSVAGAAFKISYPAAALQLEDSRSHSPGALVPSDALTMWNVSPAQNDYSRQDGSLYAAFSSPKPWLARNGDVAVLTFKVLDDALTQPTWTIRVTQAETSDGVGVRPVSGSEITLQGRLAAAPSFGDIKVDSRGRVTMRLATEAGVHYQLETSTDLHAWQNINVNPNEAGEIVLDPASLQSGHQFFRAVVRP